MSSTSIQNVLSGCYEEKSVAIKGWVYRKRESKDVIFLMIRDATGIIQCTVKRKHPMWDIAERVTIESSVSLRGTVRRDKRAPGGFEISVEKLEIVGLAETFPITKDQCDNEGEK